MGEGGCRGEFFWFLKRVVVRVAEEKGMALCRREEEKAEGRRVCGFGCR